MVAQELRLGNIIAFSGGSTPKTIKVTIDVLKQLMQTDYDLSGIPITEEWLIKFGFYQSIGQWFIDSLNGSFSIEIHSYNFYYSAGEGIRISSSIETVHGLQNLYHALTGEELKCSI